MERGLVAYSAGRCCRVDLEAPRQVGGAAEQLLVEPVAPAADRLRAGSARARRTSNASSTGTFARRAPIAAPMAPPTITPGMPSPPSCSMRDLVEVAAEPAPVGGDVVQPRADHAGRDAPRGDRCRRGPGVAAPVELARREPAGDQDADRDQRAVPAQLEDADLEDQRIGRARDGEQRQAGSRACASRPRAGASRRRTASPRGRRRRPRAPARRRRSSATSLRRGVDAERELAVLGGAVRRAAGARARRPGRAPGRTTARAARCRRDAPRTAAAATCPRGGAATRSRCCVSSSSTPPGASDARALSSAAQVVGRLVEVAERRVPGQRDVDARDVLGARRGCRPPRARPGIELGRPIAGGSEHRGGVVEAGHVVAADGQRDRDAAVTAAEIDDPGGARRTVLGEYLPRCRRRRGPSGPASSAPAHRSRYVSSKKSRHQSPTHESVA